MVRKWAWLGCALLAVGCATNVSEDNGPPIPQPSQTPVPTPEPTPTPVDPTGDGRDGSPTISSDFVVNRCTVLQSATGTQAQVLDSSGLTDGDVVLLIQMQTNFASSAMTAPVSDAAGAGGWHLGRVEAVSTGVIELDSAVAQTFTSGSNMTAQLCRVPQFADVTVTPTGRMLAASWNGSTGGVVAFLANGTILNDGEISASELGFAGGVVGEDEQDLTNNVNRGELDLPLNVGGGKGEGLHGEPFADAAGRGARANAAGGGNAHNAGGGGGGNGGAGGTGGMQTQHLSGAQPQTSGLGGGQVDLTTMDFELVLGGGGGAGHQNNSVGGAGASGGGIVFMVINDLAGSGAILTNGGNGGFSRATRTDGGLANTSDGAGGGGAGGSIWLQVRTSAFTGAISAVGGAGGNNGEQTYYHGTGGGGGGGRAYLHNITTAADVSGGAAGIHQDWNDNAWGATAGGAGVIAPAPAL